MIALHLHRPELLIFNFLRTTEFLCAGPPVTLLTDRRRGTNPFADLSKLCPSWEYFQL